MTPRSGEKRYTIVRQPDGTHTVTVTTWAAHAELHAPVRRPWWRLIAGAHK